MVMDRREFLRLGTGVAAAPALAGLATGRSAWRAGPIAPAAGTATSRR